MYTQFFGLREEPFRLTPDPKFLHLAEPHRTALNVLLEGILTRKGFLVLCGPIGTGKTMLMHSALRLLEEDPQVKGRLKSAFIANPTLNREEFLEAILEEFEVPCSAKSKPGRLSALHEMLLACYQNGGTAVLSIDEAHLLTLDLLEEIRLLGNVDTYKEKLLQIVLSGQPELQVCLNHPSVRALKQRIAASCQLRPLSLPETSVYVAERLHAAGLQGDSPFDIPVLNQVFTYTNGVPRLINLLCDRALSIGVLQQKLKLDSVVVDEAAGKLDLLSEQPEMLTQLQLSDEQNTKKEANPQQELSTGIEEDIRAAIDLMAFALDLDRCGN